MVNDVDAVLILEYNIRYALSCSQRSRMNYIMTPDSLEENARVKVYDNLEKSGEWKGLPNGRCMSLILRVTRTQQYSTPNVQQDRFRTWMIQGGVEPP